MGCGGTTQIGTPADAERAEQDKMIQVNLARINRKLIVMSGKGGVGKSTFSSCMALLLSKKGFKAEMWVFILHRGLAGCIRIRIADSYQIAPTTCFAAVYCASLRRLQQNRE